MNDINYDALFKMSETYQFASEANGKGTFYYTDCGNRMYSVCGPDAYHKKICPKCGKVLLMRGTKDGITYMDWKAGKLQLKEQKNG